MSGSGGASQTPNPGVGGGSPLPSGMEIPSAYVPPPQPGATGGMLSPAQTLRKVRSEVQRRRTLVLLMFLIVAVAILDWGPEPPNVRLDQPTKNPIEARVSFTWTDSSEERIETIFQSKPLYYRETPISEWIATSLRDLYTAMDLYRKGMKQADFEQAVAADDLLQPKFARYLFLYLDDRARRQIDPDRAGNEGEVLKEWLEVHLLGHLASKSNYFVTREIKDFEGRRTKAGEFKIIRENEIDTIPRKRLTPDNYPARLVPKEGWINLWRLHEDLDPELRRQLADGVSTGAIDTDMKDGLYEYLTGYQLHGPGDRQTESPTGRKRHLGPTLELLGGDKDSYIKPPENARERPRFQKPASAPDEQSLQQPALPNWSLANYYLRVYVEEVLGSDVTYRPRTDPSEPLSDQNVLVPAGTKINRNHLNLLWAHAREVKANATLVENVQRIGRHLVAVLVAVLLFLTVLHYAAPATLRELQKTFNLTLVALAVLACAKVLTEFAPVAPDLLGQLVMATPVILLGMIATIAFGEIVAVVAVASLSLLVGYLAGGGLTENCWRFMLPLTVGGWIGMLGVRQTRTQGKYLLAGFLGGLAQGVAALLFELPQQNFGDAWLFDVGNWLIGSGDLMIPSLFQGLLSGMIVAAFLKLIERAFDVLTPLGLLELNDDQHPALRRIATYANGTYAHSKAVGLLSEAAAESIRADVLLVRVGVAFHDLGKTSRPEEYIENNPAAHSLHDNREPIQSAQIIIAHVHDGIQLARLYRLPQQVIDFIPQHHGNDLVKFFYHKARRMAQERGEDPDSISESAFRYPGPKPKSRETAIVMMADTIDAASRTLKDPTPEKMRTFTHNLIMDKLGSGQLDECGLTFRDIDLCEKSFLRVLAARYHQRTRYPGQELTEGDQATEATLQLRPSKIGALPTAAVMPVRVDRAPAPQPLPASAGEIQTAGASEPAAGMQPEGAPVVLHPGSEPPAESPPPADSGLGRGVGGRNNFSGAAKTPGAKSGSIPSPRRPAP